MATVTVTRDIDAPLQTIEREWETPHLGERLEGDPRGTVRDARLRDARRTRQSPGDARLSTLPFLAPAHAPSEHPFRCRGGGRRVCSRATNPPHHL